MAVYVLIQRISEYETHANYLFGKNEELCGEFQIDKASGEVSMLRPAQGDNADNASFRCAEYKIKGHWKAGEMPNRSCFAA